MGEEEIKPKVQPEHKGFFEELLGDVFNLDRGLPATILGMFKQPGAVIDSYFTDRGRFVSPLRYCIIILAVTTFISVRFIDYEAMMTTAMESGAGTSIDEMANQLSQVMPGFDWKAYFEALNELTVIILQKFVQVIYLALMAPLMAFFTKLFFKKKQPKFINHYVMLVYSLTTFAIIGLLFFPLMLQLETTGSMLGFFLSVPVTLGFLLWHISSYLKLKGFSEIFQGFLALLLGYISYSILSGILLYVGAFIKVII